MSAPADSASRRSLALDVLARRGLIVAVLRRWRVPQVEHDDLVQDVVVAALTSDFDADGRGTFAAWVAGVASRVCGLRHRALRVARANELSLTHGAWSDHGGSWARSPESLVAALEEARSVRAALATLPDAQTSTATAHYFEELTPTQIALATDTKPATVATRLARASRSLREQLAEVYAPGGDREELIARRKVVIWRAVNRSNRTLTASAASGGATP